MSLKVLYNAGLSLQSHGFAFRGHFWGHFDWQDQAISDEVCRAQFSHLAEMASLGLLRPTEACRYKWLKRPLLYH